ncbi:hypothetical protein ANCDUO_12826 [Ancylostoma duodenale]|uniref:Uncharacterized protein n=1 Tax=Ancylostoma duodenale TaxID=51022 RepID=A0A0C2G7R0_9BILA|nr:hypothetical protein ANCDUO_12826 [Ancylostoma duodenale]
MPSAVFCSLLAGIAAVIEIHYSIDFNHLDWSEKWSWAAADSVALCTIHAVLAFALQGLRGTRTVPGEKLAVMLVMTAVVLKE